MFPFSSNKEIGRRLHRPLLYALLELLDQSFNQGFYADKVLERYFYLHRAVGSRDRKFLAETFYDIVRWWLRLRWITGLPIHQIEKNKNSAAGAEKNVISEDDFKSAVSAWLSLQGFDLTFMRKEGFEFDTSKIQNHCDRINSLAPDWIKQSFPEWIWSRGKKELGDEWEILTQNLNHSAPLFLRANSLIATPQEVQQALRVESVEVKLIEQSEQNSWALRVMERKNVFSTQSFQRGFFEVQDLHSQKIAPFLQVKPGMRVIDACAGAGGKSLHLAALMNNTGRILCLDIHEKKLQELKRRARRAGATNIETRLIQSGKVIKRLEKKADRLLLDVPCTGMGVLRRNPDVKWKLKEQDFDRLFDLQQNILDRYSQMVKPKGKLVYATCSVFSSENEKQIERFLSCHSSWELEDSLRLLPTGANSGDGFYAARLVRTS